MRTRRKTTHVYLRVMIPSPASSAPPTNISRYAYLYSIVFKSFLLIVYLLLMTVKVMKVMLTFFLLQDFYYVAPAMQQPPTQWAEPPSPHVLPCASTLCGSCVSATRSSLGSLGLSITRCRELDMGLDVSSMQARRPRARKRVRFQVDRARPSPDLTEVDQTKVHLDMMAKDQVSNKRGRVDHSFVQEVLFP